MQIGTGRIEGEAQPAILEAEVRLRELAQQDPVYQQLLAQCGEAEPEFLQVKERLSRQDQKKLERYLSLCEELDYRMLRLALELDRMIVVTG